MTELDGESLLRIDRAVQRFEDGWRAGARPSLESLLDGEPDGRARALVLRYALAVELSYRRRHGEDPERGEYIPRFPDHALVVVSAFDETTLPDPPPGTTVSWSAPARGPADAAADVGPGAVTPPGDSPPRIGKYQVVHRFAQKGGQATAYLAVDTDLERHVVLKRYHDSNPEAAGEAEEGRALAKVVSPFVARCYGVERIDGAAFLVVEYVPGRNLGEVRRARALGIDEVVRVVGQLAEGVAAVHARGLIHRDIKPANVILHDDGTPRLVDFGLAAHLGSRQLRQLGGSPPYMAPEQARGEWDRIDQRTDIFGLGAVLYELLTNTAPYAGADVFEVLGRAKARELTGPRRLAPATPARVEAVCLKALEAAPENRYASAAEFAAALRAAVPRAPGAAPPVRYAAPLRWGLIAAVVVGGFFLARAAWRGRDFPPSSAPGSVPPPPSNAPIRASLEVAHFKDVKDGRPAPLGTVSEHSLESDPPRLQDLLRVRVRLSRPAFARLLALNPDGTIQLCAPTDDSARGSARSELEFPEDPGDYFSLTDGVGLQAFVIVAADEPLPAFESWKTLVPGGLVWLPVDRQGFWTYDSTTAPQDAAAPDGRGPGAPFRGGVGPKDPESWAGRPSTAPLTEVGTIVRRESTPECLVDLCDRLRHVPGATLVRAVAFPVAAGKRGGQ